MIASFIAANSAKWGEMLEANIHKYLEKTNTLKEKKAKARINGKKVITLALPCLRETLEWNTCKIDGWRHQNGLNVVFNFQVKLISSERALEEEQNSENRFWLRHVKFKLWDFKEIWVHPWNHAILPPLHNRTQNSTWRHGRVGQPGPRNTLLTHVKNSTVILILRTGHSQTRKPEKTNYWKNRDSVTPTYAMASPLGL